MQSRHRDRFFPAHETGVIGRCTAHLHLVPRQHLDGNRWESLRCFIIFLLTARFDLKRLRRYCSGQNGELCLPAAVVRAGPCCHHHSGPSIQIVCIGQPVIDPLPQRHTVQMNRNLWLLLTPVVLHRPGEDGHLRLRQGLSLPHRPRGRRRHPQRGNQQNDRHPKAHVPSDSFSHGSALLWHFWVKSGPFLS